MAVSTTWSGRSKIIGCGAERKKYWFPLKYMTPVAYILHFTLPFLSSKKFRLPKLGHGARVPLTDVAAHENSCSPQRTIFENSTVAQVRV